MSDSQRDLPKENKDMQTNFEDFLVLKTNDEGDVIRYTVTSDPEAAKIRIQDEFDDSITSLRSSNDLDLGEQLKNVNSSFARFLHKYSENIKGFYHLIGLDIFIQTDLRDSYIDTKLIDFASRNLIELDKSSGVLVYGIPIPKISQTNKHAREVGEFIEGTKRIPSLLLMGLVARFDAHLSSFVRLLLRDRPEAIGSRQSEFDLATVLSFGDIEELKDLFIDQEVYRLMHASHHEQVQFIEQTFHVSLQEKIVDYPRFLEIFERRNLVAHGEDEVNARYDSRCRLHKVSDEHRLKIGEEIIVSPSYLLKSTDIIYQFGFILIWSLWMKRHKDEVELSYGVILENTFNLMIEKWFELVSSILNYILKHPINHADDLHLRMFAVNKAICDKRLKRDDWRATIDGFKWGSSAANFKICIAAIDEDISEVCKLMAQVCSSSLPPEERIGPNQFREWPAFYWVRDNEEFRAKFYSIFGENLVQEPESDLEISDDETAE